MSKLSIIKLHAPREGTRYISADTGTYNEERFMELACAPHTEQFEIVEVPMLQNPKYTFEEWWKMFEFADTGAFAGGSEAFYELFDRMFGIT